MKTILLFDPRFPLNHPRRLTVADEIASAAVRAGVAAAANPSEAGALATGSPLSQADITEVILQHGATNTALARVFVPLSVAQVGAGLGMLAAVGRPIAGSIPSIFPQFPIGTKISVLGDSTVAHGTFGASPGDKLVRKLNAGHYEVAQALKPRFAMEEWPSNTTARDNAAAGGTSSYTKQWVDGGNRAVSGSPVSFHAGLLPSTLAMGAPILAYSATVNSAALPGAEQTIIDQILTPAINAGKYVLVGTMLPWAASGTGLDTPANVASRMRINTALRAWAASVGPTKALLLDWDIPFPLDGSNYASSDNFYDTLHPNSLGAARLSLYLNSRLDLILPSDNQLLTRTAPNKQPNPTFTGTTGTAAGTVSGQVPSGYRLINASGTVSTAVASLEANAATGGQSLVITVQPVSGSIAEEGFNFTYGTAGTIPVSDMAGQYVATYFEVEVPASPYVGVPTAYLYDAGSTMEARALDLDTTYGNSSKSDGSAKTFWVATDPVLVGASSTGPNVTLRLRLRGAEAFAAGAAPITIKIKRVWTGVVGDPKPRWNAS
ncbi:SGNH/GDSL hydrolase family protein [Sphingomonas sp. Leaf257]|uniref:SGNH/GDSL hydrolase family protein n=1 Tax=Sphingomonas sp. Leaf257 TaxID=1736309 RepID=UPI000A83FDD8|nr:SGNH/GDSL hydrolase family protein [Sphingomonas sp. Leaf257]